MVLFCGFCLDYGFIHREVLRCPSVTRRENDSNDESQEVGIKHREKSIQNQPTQRRVRNLALNRTCVCLLASTPLEKVHDEKTFVFGVCGKLEGYPVRVTEVILSEPISKCSSPLSLCILALLEISWVHRTPLPQRSSKRGTTESAHIGDPITLQACVAKGPAAQLCWLFSHGERDKEVWVERTCESLNSSLMFPDFCVITPNKMESAVFVHAASHTYPTNTNVTFLVVTDMHDPLDFLWNFGDSTTAKTSSRNITKRYSNAGKYNVTVSMSDGHISITSGVFSILIQREVKLNKLFHRAYVLRNHKFTVNCRVNSGSDVIFLWNFGDGTTRMGQSTEQHTFLRTGEFQIKVTAFNRVSSAYLSSIIFVLDHPCQPPPVKNMGPLKIQVRRHNVIHLGVSYDADVKCDVMRGLHYTWMLFDTAGHILPVPDAHKQSLVLPRHLLHYDTYTATARVKVIGSMVYSNYTVRVHVIPSLPVANIQGGTNFFMNNKIITVVTLDGQRSYNPDFPTDPVRFKWMCEPVSSIKSSCFNSHVATNASMLTFPMSFLKHNFDQFRFTLTVHSGELSSLTEAFVTLTPNVVGRLTLSCRDCEGDQINWDQSISVKATCEDCEVPPNRTQYTWTLYLVNASSKPVVEVEDFSILLSFLVPFCIAVDLSTPSTIMGEKPPYHPQKEIGLQESLYSNALGDRTVHLHQKEIGRKLDIDYDSSTDWESADIRDGQDYDVTLQMAEGEPGTSAGRLTDVKPQTLKPGDDPMISTASHDIEGSNLLESSPRLVIRDQTLLDLPRELIDAGFFTFYTKTGPSSGLLTFMPFSLKPGSMYMLEVTAKSQNIIVGRTQLFLRTKPVPKGMTCQVQPSKGLELYTHFSIFCTSGRADLLYEYSFSVGNKPSRMLYQGRNFEYYFNLPSGHPSDDYKVTVYTKIKSSMYGSSTKVCPVTVQVLPSFFRNNSSNTPDIKLSQYGLNNLSALILLGNSAEICNYVSLLTSILNRLSLDSQADQQTQRHMRSVLIATMCNLEIRDQDSMGDNIGILEDLLKVTKQVTLVSVRQVAARVQAIAGQLSRFSNPKLYQLDQRTLKILVTLLSYCLEATVTTHDVTAETTDIPDVTCKVASDQQDRVNIDSTCDYRQASRTKQVEQLVENILQTATDLILKHALFNRMEEHRVNGGLISLFIARQNSSVSVIYSGLVKFYLPPSLIHTLRGECILGLIDELKYSPWTQTNNHVRISGPVVEMALYKCSTGRKIAVRSLVQPIIVEMQTQKCKKDSVHYHVLLRNRINYHSFNITQEHLQQAIQLSVEFTIPPNRPFPIMLLFRMFAKPTPSMNHLKKIHLWGSNTSRITFPQSYLSTPGVGYLALLNSNFGKPNRNKHLSRQINYTLEVHASQCLSFDRSSGTWSQMRCSTHQTDRSDAVNCSCHHLKALSMVQNQIQCFYKQADLDPSFSKSTDTTILVVLLLCACLYIPAWLACKKEDGISQQNQRVHYLNDNCRLNPHRYVITIHTGLCSAYRLSAKVYIVLYGASGKSHTRELDVPGCTLFRRNSRDTFLISTAESLGQVWGVHIWHDNSGLSPHLYLKLVEVSEVGQTNMEGRTWNFVSQCWLSVNKDDGKVERMLHACTRGIGLTQMLQLTLCDYMADFHMWMSVYSCPRPHSFTQTQRLSVCLLLFALYACVNALVISNMDEVLHFEDGITALSFVSLTTGALSVVAALPLASLITLLFRVHKLKQTMQVGETQIDQDSCEVDDTEAFNQKYQDAEKLVTRDVITKENGIQTEVIQKQIGIQEEAISKDGSEGGSFHQTACFQNSRHLCVFDQLEWSQVRPTWQWCYYLAWALCLFCSFAALLLSALLGLRFDSSKIQLWLHSLVISLLLCIFFIQPIVIFAISVTVSIWCRNRTAFHSSFKIFFKAEQNVPAKSERSCNLEKFVENRRRARFLRLVRPPSVKELRLIRTHMRREALIHKTFRDFCFYFTMFLLMLCISHDSSFNDHYHLNNAVRRQFTGRGEEPTFMPIQKYEDWWKWTQQSILNLLYKNTSTENKSDISQRSYVLIGQPVVWTAKFCRKRSSECPPSHVTAAQSVHLGLGKRTGVQLGHTKSEAMDRLRVLQCDSCVVLKVQFTVYSPAPDLFTTATLLAEQNPIGSLMISAIIQSAKVYHNLTFWDYVVSVSQVLFLCLSLLHLWIQVSTAWQKGLIGYCTASCNWIHVSLQVVIFMNTYHDIYRSVDAMEIVEILQRNNDQEHLDITLLAAREQNIRSLRGILLLILTVKCASMLKKRSMTLLPSSLPIFTSVVILLLVIRYLYTLFIPSWDKKVIGGLLHYGHSLHSFRTFGLCCAAEVMAIMCSSGKKTLQSNKEVCILMELGDYIRRRVCKLIGYDEPVKPPAGYKTHYLEELETSVDELLFILNRLHIILLAVDDPINNDIIHEVPAYKQSTSQG
ncbi:polycystin-1-like protein 1 [Stigmatopora argus]